MRSPSGSVLESLRSALLGLPGHQKMGLISYPTQRISDIARSKLTDLPVNSFNLTIISAEQE